MFRTKTVFILGAGASHEVDLPVGSRLAEIISDKVDIRYDHGHPGESGDRRLYTTLVAKYGRDASHYQHAGWLIRDGVLLTNSIDDFLNRHAASNPRAVEYGKLAIVGIYPRRRTLQQNVH